MSDDIFKKNQESSENNINSNPFEALSSGTGSSGFDNPDFKNTVPNPEDSSNTVLNNNEYSNPFDKIGDNTINSLFDAAKTEHTEGQQQSRDNTNQGSGNPPAYSFWAEQIAASANRQEEALRQVTIKEESGHAYQDKTESSFYGDSRVFQLEEEAGNRKAKPKKGLAGKAVKLLFGAAVFGLVAGGAFIGFNEVYYRINPNASSIRISFVSDNGNGLSLTPPKDEAKRLSATTVSDKIIEQKTDVTDVVEATMPSIVTITTTYTQAYYDWFGQQVDRESQGGGSGIIVGKNEKELLIATNNHVVEGADPITVKFIDGTEATAVIKGTDAVADLAVISIDLTTISEEALNSIKIAKLGDSEAVKVGEMAIAIGNALGYGQSTTVGYISAKDREVKLTDKTMVLLQTDAAINPGNSGGALLNLKGEVIGINTVKYASSEVEGMGFAIPISRAVPIIDELMNREILADNEKGYLGVYIRDVTEEVAQMYNWPIGVYVTETAPEGSAAKAGILAGDIITGVNDTEVTAATQLQDKVTSYRIGTEITVTVMRSVNGRFEEKQITVTLGERPAATNNR